MMHRVKQWYHDQQMFPGLFGVFVNPFYLARAALAEAMRHAAPEVGGRMLDAGCGSKPYQNLFSVAEYVGLEIDSPEARARNVADVYYDGHTFPFEDTQFDTVLCNQVLEHVFQPERFLTEIHRVLRPRGRLLLTVPFVWDEHEQPWDFARYSSFGLAALLERNGFTVLEHAKLRANASTLFQLGNAYLFKISCRWPRPARLLLTATVMAAGSILGVLAARLLPDNPDLYLDHVVLAERRE